METVRIRDRQIRIYPTTEELNHAAARLFVCVAQETLKSAGRFSVVLSGGSTPEPMYRLLTQDPYCGQVNWNRTHVFWGDERCVPRNDARNNARMAMDTLLDHVPIPQDRVHPVLSEKSPVQAADHYEAVLRSFFGDVPARFDLVLLGLGENGHTASLFPHTSILQEHNRWVKEVYVQEQDMYRVSLTAAIINQAGTVAFMANGNAKAQVLRDVLLGPWQPEELPAQLIRPKRGEAIWLVDRDAASKLPRQESGDRK